MRYPVALLAVVCLFSPVGDSGIAAQQAQIVSTPGTPICLTPVATDEKEVALRSDMQASRAAIMAKNLTLTSEQSTKFWPIFEAYQKEQNVIMDEQAKGAQRFVESFETLDDAGALALIKVHLDRDERMNALRQKVLLDLQRAVGTKVAARAVQIDRRFSLVCQLEISSKIPLIR